MNRIKIESQEEFNNLPESFEDTTSIEIHSEGTITIKKPIFNAKITLYGNSSAELFGNSSARLFDRSSARLFDMTRVRLFGSSSARLFDRSSARIFDMTRVRLFGRSSAELFGSSSAELFDRSSARIFDMTRVRLFGRSSAELFGSSSAELFGSSSARLFDMARAKLYENSTLINHSGTTPRRIESFDNSTVKNIDPDLKIPFDTWIERGMVVADGIYQEYISHEELDDMIIYKTDGGYVARRKDTYAHGDTKEEARIDLRFKLSDRDKSEFKDWSVGEIRSKEDLIIAYRTITGACSSGTRDFVKNKAIPDKLTVNQVIELTSGAYGSEEFREFFLEGGEK